MVVPHLKRAEVLVEWRKGDMMLMIGRECDGRGLVLVGGELRMKDRGGEGGWEEGNRGNGMRQFCTDWRVGERDASGRTGDGI